MKYFTQAYVDFFKELAANNNRDWFHANKKRYESEVKKPFADFVAEVIKAFCQLDEEITILPKDAIFRIYRDVRFSKDKTPYKLNSSAVISRGGRKDTIPSGIYLELSAEELRIYGGAWAPDKKQLHDIRTALMRHEDIFREIYEEEGFASHFGALHGERNVRLPKDFQAAAINNPYLYNKQFYFYRVLPVDIAMQEDLIAVVLAHYKAARGMNTFLREAMV